MMTAAVEAMRRANRQDLELRFFRKMQYDGASGCWLWIGRQDGNGYGELDIGKGHQKAHRVAYRLFVGPIPKGLCIDHLCRVKACVNPAHLEAVTQGENVRRNWTAIGHPSARKTHCKNGHAFTPENTGDGGRGYGRVCRACRAAASHAYRARKAQGEHQQ